MNVKMNAKTRQESTLIERVSSPYTGSFSHLLKRLIGLMALTLFPMAVYAQSQDWKDQQLADALTAAPAVVTDSAKIYAWNDKAEMVLIRDGVGPFVCVASGQSSTRLGKPASPFPDPACFDQNAWAFFQAFWSEPNPMQPSKPYPTAPGVAWMLAGMPVAEGMLQLGTDVEAQTVVTDSGAKITRISPHLMVMPLPVHEGESIMLPLYDPSRPDANWTMVANTPLEHMMIHFSEEEVKALMNPK